MNDLNDIMQPLLRTLYVWLALCILVWLFILDWRPYAAGMFLGSLISWVNAQFLVMKIRQVTAMVLEKKGRRANIGFVSRVCFSLIAVMAAVRIEEIDLLTTILGFFYCPIVAFFVGIYALRKDKQS